MPVVDLDLSGRRLLDRYGLVSVFGGRHPEVGTANRIVPLGSTYLELIAVVDPAQAAGQARAHRIRAATAAQQTFLTWAARTTDIDGMRRRLIASGWGVGETVNGSRERPDGTLLAWRSLDLLPTVESTEAGVLPFLIQWGQPPAQHPGAIAVDHPSHAGDVMALRFEDPKPDVALVRLRTLLGDRVEYRVAPGPASRLVAVELKLPEGRLLLS